MNNIFLGYLNNKPKRGVVFSMQPFIWHNRTTRPFPKKWITFVKTVLLLPLFVTTVVYFSHLNSAEIVSPLVTSSSALYKPIEPVSSTPNKRLDRQRQRKRKVWYVSSKGSECLKVGRRYRNDELPLPLTALLSTEGSGNTWLRWLIERLTGICTGSVYKEYFMKKSGFQCETNSLESGTAIVYKAHYMHHINTTKVLLLIRNPFDAIISDYNRMMTRGNHTAVADSQVFGSPEWHAHVLGRSTEWLDLIRAAFNQASELLVIFYENLKTDPAKDLYRIAYFLGVRVNEFRVNCTIENSLGFAKRPERKDPLPEDIFTPAETIMIDNYIARASDLFEKHNISSIPSFYTKNSN